MFDFFYHITDKQVFVIMLVTAILLSLILAVLGKYFLFYRLRYKDNTTTASIAALIGIIYGVMVGFLCLYLLNNQDHVSTAASNEGIAAANIYRDSLWLRSPTKNTLQTNLKKYITRVINEEWPLMMEGKIPDLSNSYIINEMSVLLKSYPITSQTDNMIVTDLIQEIKDLFKYRQERIEISQNQLSLDIWAVVLLSTILIIVINYAFRVSFYLHVFTITVFAIMAASILFLLVTLDRPFQGEFIVEPSALQAVLDTMAHDGL